MTENENMGLRRNSRPSNSTLKSLCKASEQKEKGYKLGINKAIEKKANKSSREHIQFTLTRVRLCSRISYSII